MQLWYPMADPKLVASLSKTNFGLPEDESKITLPLLAVFPSWAQHGADSEGGGAVLGLLIPVLVPPALRQPSTCSKNQEPWSQLQPLVLCPSCLQFAILNQKVVPSADFSISKVVISPFAPL